MKPMLAGKCEDMQALQFPVMASPKLDGVRALVIGGVLMSRSLKAIPNAWCQRMFAGLPEGTDGELIFGEPTHPDAYRNTVSAVMSEDGEPKQVNYHIFDNFTIAGGFQSRFKSMSGDVRVTKPNVQIVPHSVIPDADTLEQVEALAVETGHEGIMIRSLNGPYKQGRSTAKEGWLLKVKRFEDAEAIILSCYEWETNNNAATKNALGRTERSSHKDGKVGAGVLGGFNVRGVGGTYDGIEFSVGTGFSGADDPAGQRAQLWRARTKLVDKLIKFKYFASGSKDRPRFPVYLGFRDKRDM